MEHQLYYDDEPTVEEEGIDVKKYVQMLFKRKWLITAITLAITIPWTIYVKSQPPIYEATCLIRFKDYEYDDESLLIQSRMTELTSRTFAEKVVAQLGLILQMDEENHTLNRWQLFQEFSSTSNPVSGEYIFRWDEDGTYSLFYVLDEQMRLIDSGSLLDATVNPKTVNGFTFLLSLDVTSLPKEVKFKIDRFRDAVKSLRSRTQVGVARGSNLMSLTLTDRDPVLVTKMVNRLAEIYVDASRSLKRESIENRRKILEEKLGVIEKKLTESDNALKQFKESHFVSLDTEVKKQMEELFEKEKELTDLKEQRENLIKLLSKIEDESNSDDNMKYVYRQIASLPTFVNNPMMGVFQQKLAGLEEERRTIVQAYSETHQDAIELESKILGVQSQIKKTAEEHLKNLDQEIASLTQKRNQLDYKLKQLPEEEYRLTELARERKINEDIYTNLLTEFQRAQITEAVETEDVDILDPAIEPEYPVNGDKKKRAIIGAFFGLILAVAVAFGLEFLDKSIKTVDDVKKHLRLQVIGIIPNIDFKDVYDYQDSEKIKQIDQQLVTHDYSPTPIGEAYRSLRTNLVFSKTAGHVQSFVITSSAPGDGKSFTAANIAISMAQHKSNTLLIDGDLRRGVLHNTFGCPKEPGFTNFLTNMVSFNQIINETLIPNLSLVSCGSLLPNPSELLGSYQMKRFLDEARRKYDMVIFDSPPLNAATDAIVIGTQVDAVVIVIRSGITDRDVARQKLEMFTNVPARILGVVLNGTTAEFGHEGYSYYHY